MSTLCKYHSIYLRGLGRISSAIHLLFYHNQRMCFFKELLYFLFFKYTKKTKWVYYSYNLIKYYRYPIWHDWVDIFDKKVYDLSISSHNPVILDIGAHIGSATLFFAQKYPTAHIYSYEPNPNVFPILNENIIHNIKLPKRIITKQEAVVGDGTKQQYKPFYYLENDASTSATLFRNKFLKQKKRIRKVIVPITTLHKILITTGKIDLMKIDIEGGEYDIISSIISHKKLIKSFVMEVHYWDKYKDRILIPNLIKQLSSAYSLFFATSTGIVNARVTDIIKDKYQPNALFIIYGKKY